jgi:hypothetical protein
VSVALGTQREMSVRHVFVCGLTGSTLISVLHYLLNGKVFEIKLPNTKSLFRISLQILSETFLIVRKKISARYCHKCARVFM